MNEYYERCKAWERVIKKLMGETVFQTLNKLVEEELKKAKAETFKKVKEP